jgi:hypothetical protein
MEFNLKVVFIVQFIFFQPFFIMNGSAILLYLGYDVIIDSKAKGKGKNGYLMVYAKKSLLY